MAPAMDQNDKHEVNTGKNSLGQNQDSDWHLVPKSASCLSIRTMHKRLWNESCNYYNRLLS